MKYYFQFITTPTADTVGTAILLHFDDRRYLFGNVSEGTQRAFVERGVRLSKLSNVFLTGKTEWATHGGLLGMILTLADVQANAQEARAQTAQQKGKSGRSASEKSVEVEREKRPPFTIHGGPNITHSLAAARRFIFRKNLPLTVEERDVNEPSTTEEPTWSDEHIQVWALKLNPSSAQYPKTRRSRKRSHEDFEESGSVESTKDFQLRNAVISAMFDSDWRLDALSPMPLDKVQMPAAIFVRDPVTKQIKTYTGPRPGGPEPLPKIEVLIRRPWPGALIETLPRARPSEAAMSYIIRGHPIRGKFLHREAVELGVQPGPDFARLTKGESVQSANGTTVTPDMVMEPNRPGKGVAIIDLPTCAHLESLLEQPGWSCEEPLTGIDAIIWLLGPGVTRDARLQEFVKSKPGIRHLNSSIDCCPNSLTFDSSAASAIRLFQMSKDHFPIPIHDNLTLPQSYALREKPGELDFGLFQPAVRDLQLLVEPRLELVDAEVTQPLNTSEVVKHTPALPLALALEEKRALANPNQAQHDLPGKDAEIFTLGTGSALPSKYRNVSGTLLRVPGKGSYLLDCGENTLGQLRRVFEAEQLKEILRDLKAIWISHLHADHHLGTASIIRAWRDAVFGQDRPEITPLTLKQRLSHPDPAVRKCLFVLSDIAMIKWLKEYSDVEDIGMSHVIPLAAIPQHNKFAFIRSATSAEQVTFDHPTSEVSAYVRAASGLENVKTCNVQHCWGALAVSLTFADGFKVSYSGDCRPSVVFSEIGKDSTVLIHEATFDDEMAGNALAKKHSTTSEALGVGIAMGARRIILTHFSQRYQKIPVVSDIKLEDIRFDDTEDTGDPDGPLDAEGVSSTSATGDDLNHSTSQDRLYEARQHSDSATLSSRDALTTQEQFEPQIDHTQPQETPPNPAVKLQGFKPRPDMKVAVAFDYMRVKVGEIAHLERLTPALMSLFESLEAANSGTSASEDQNAENGVDDGGDAKVKSDIINRSKLGKQKAPKREVA